MNKALVFFFTFVAVSIKPIQVLKPAPLVYHSVYPYSIGFASYATQYHSQDGLGGFTYSYSNPQSSKTETKSIDGVTRGAYSYIDPEGRLQSVEYTSGVDGFRVAATNLPVAPRIQMQPLKDTPEVMEARHQHMAVVEQVKSRTAEHLPAVNADPIAPLLPHPFSYGFAYPAGVYAAPLLASQLAPVIPAETPEPLRTKSQDNAAAKV